MSKSHTTIIGIDPGPVGFAWASLKDGLTFTGYGEILRSDYMAFHQAMTSWEQVAIETITGGRILGKATADTARMVGWLEGFCVINNIPYVLVTRKEAAESCGKPGRLMKGQRYGDAQIIRYLHMMYPELTKLRPLKDYNHIYAACAVAHCAVGKLQKNAITANAVEGE